LTSSENTSFSRKSVAHVTRITTVREKRSYKTAGWTKSAAQAKLQRHKQLSISLSPDFMNVWCCSYVR